MSGLRAGGKNENIFGESRSPTNCLTFFTFKGQVVRQQRSRLDLQNINNFPIKPAIWDVHKSHKTFLKNEKQRLFHSFTQIHFNRVKRSGAKVVEYKDLSKIAKLPNTRRVLRNFLMLVIPTNRYGHVKKPANFPNKPEKLSCITRGKTIPQTFQIPGTRSTGSNDDFLHRTIFYTR